MREHIVLARGRRHAVAEAHVRATKIRDAIDDPAADRTRSAGADRAGPRREFAVPVLGCAFVQHGRELRSGPRLPNAP